EAAAGSIRGALTSAGGNLGDASVYVFPMLETKSSLLVIDLGDDVGKLISGSGQMTGQALPALPALPAVITANITRVAVIFRGKDSHGPYTGTATLPISALFGPSAEMQKQL